MGLSDREKSDLTSFVIYTKWSKLIGCWVWLYWRALEIVSDTLSSWGADGLALYCEMLCSLLCPEMNIIWRSDTFISESTVIAEARTEWLVYTWERFAPLDMIFIMYPSLFTPSGLFSYHTMSSVVNLAFGFWKNAGQEGFNLDTYNLRLANASSSALVCQDLDTKVCNYNSQLLILFLAFYVHFQSLMYTIVRLYILAYTTPQAVNCFYSNHV